MRRYSYRIRWRYWSQRIKLATLVLYLTIDEDENELRPNWQSGQ